MPTNQKVLNRTKEIVATSNATAKLVSFLKTLTKDERRDVLILADPSIREGQCLLFNLIAMIDIDEL